MSRRTLGANARCNAVLVATLALCCTGAEPGDEFWDDRFGIPGVPYEEGGVNAMLVVGDDLYVGGVFTSIGGLSTTSIARWDGTNWHALDSGVNGSVRDLATVGGRVVVAGVFSQAGALSARNIAAWDGNAWSDVGGGVNSIISALASDRTNLYAGGQFTEAGGVAASKVAKWDGQKWSPLGAGIIPVWEPNDWVGAVDSLAVSGTEVFVGGRFRNAGGIGATNVARWDGTNWHALGNGLRYYDGPGSENGAVRALAVQAGLVFAGGSFRRAGDAAATNVARWDGQVWSELASGVNDGLSVRALLADAAGVYAGGPFEEIGGIRAERLARWDGHAWVGLGSGIGVGGLGGGVIAMASTGSELFVGGLFTTAGGKPSTNIALWHIPHSLRIGRTNGLARLSWPATGTNFLLEAKDPLPATTWSEVPQPPALLDFELVVTQAVAGASQFYRLRRR